MGRKHRIDNQSSNHRNRPAFIALLVSIAWIIAYFAMGQISHRVTIDLNDGMMISQNSGWVMVHSDGRTELLNFPTTKNGDTFQTDGSTRNQIVIRKTLPNMNLSNLAFMFWNDANEVQVYIDGVLRESYNGSSESPHGHQGASHFKWYYLKSQDSGKEIKIIFTTYNNNICELRDFYIGPDSYLYRLVIKPYLFEIVLSLVMGLLSLLFAGIAGFFEHVLKEEIGLKYFCWSIFVTSCWLYCSSVGKSVLGGNPATLRDVSYFFVAILPVPYLIFLNVIQKHRYDKIYKCLIIVTILEFAIVFVLNLLSIAEISQTLRISQGMDMVEAIIVLALLLVDIVKNFGDHRHRISYIIFGVLVLWFIIQIIRYLTVTTAYVNANPIALALLVCMFLGLGSMIQQIYNLAMKRMVAESAAEAKSEFLAKMSHEIRTPINAVIGMSDIMLRDELTDKQKEYLEVIGSSGRSLLNIVNDILDFSKAEAGKMELIKFVYPIKDMCRELEVLLGNQAQAKQLYFDIHADDDLPQYLYGDKQKLSQVIINLVNNSIKFTEQGGVELFIRITDRTESDVELTFIIKDTGMGIKEDDIDRLFGEFEQVDKEKNREKEGTGLGLSISKDIVELMGSHISVQSEYGKGSEFSFAIRQDIMNEDDYEASQLAYQQAKGITPSMNKMDETDAFIAPNAKIMIVDDNTVNLKVAMGLLEPIQIQIDVCESGSDAIKNANENTYDLIFMDYMMPNMDGITAMKKIRQISEYYHELPIIALTADVTESSRSELLTAGMSDYISKPIVVEQLYDKLQNWLPKDKQEKCKRTEVSAETDAETEELCNLHIEGIDVKLGMNYCRKPAALKSLWGDYAKIIPHKAELIRQYMSTDDWDGFRVEVHALKSTSRTIGAGQLSEQFMSLEQFAIDGKIDIIKENAEVILQEYEAFYDRLLPFTKSEDKEGEEISATQLKEILASLIGATEMFDIDAVDLSVNQLKEFHMPDSVQEQVQKIELFAADVDYDNVSKIAKEIIEVLGE